MTVPTQAPAYARVERLWPSETVVCFGTGPSLTREDVDYCRGRAKVIAIKHAIDWAPWADAIYSCGGDAGKWWQRTGPSLADYAGLRYTLDPKASEWAQVLKNTGFLGLESDPSGLRTGKNSGFQAINLAVHLGAARIVLLGYDMQPDAKDQDHFFGQHWHKSRVPFRAFVELFESLVEPLRALGIRVINASRETALKCFERMSIQEALA